MQKIRMSLVSLVCLASFYVSFSHITDVAMKYGNKFETAIVYPITIDAVILISAMTLIQRTGVNRKARFWATFGRIFGFAATIYANMVHSGWESTDSVLINAVPAVALIITVEMLIHSATGTPASRKRRQTTAKTQSGRHLKAV